MGKPSILIVDDEEHLRSALCRWFDAQGFEVDYAPNGREAVAKCELFGYDVITMDLHMPVMGGGEAVTAIREIRPQVPIVVLTGFPSEGGAEVHDHVERVLTKPIRLSELSRTVHEVMTHSACCETE